MAPTLPAMNGTRDPTANALLVAVTAKSPVISSRAKMDQVIPRQLPLGAHERHHPTTGCWRTLWPGGSEVWPANAISSPNLMNVSTPCAVFSKTSLEGHQAPGSPNSTTADPPKRKMDFSSPLLNG